MVRQEQISCTGSTATLDLQDILSSYAGDNDTLLSTRLSFSLTSDSSHSFDDVPPFPATSKPLIFVTYFATSLLRPGTQVSPSGVSEIPRPVITLPTVPRMKVMLMEKISVQAWTASVPPSAGPLDGFDAFLDGPKQTGGAPCSVDGSPPDPVEVTAVPFDGSVLSAAVLRDSSAHCGDASRQDFVPTIMVSNSTAAIPVPLGSSHNIHQEVPLAVRRGKKPPPTLALGSLPKPSMNKHLDGDPYPDIPSAFRGSPTASPTFQFSSGDPSKYNMGLSAMCSSLKALVPPPPFTPTEADLPPRPKVEPETRWGMVNSAQLPDADDQEWAFAQDLIVDWHASRGLRAEISPPPSPAGDLPYTAETVSPVCHEFSLSLTPTLTESSSDDTDEEPVQTPASVKQMRRKTVIIQAPDSESGCVFVEKIDKDPLAMVDRSLDLLPDEFDEPVPFEIPTSISGSIAQITPSGSQASSTTSAKVPVRGILKEKKSVRFSAVPSLHEYSSEKPDRPCEHHQRPSSTPSPATLSGHLKPSLVPGVRRATMPHKSSPLRESHSPMPLDACAVEATKPRFAPSTPAPTAPLPLIPGNTMAKHPAVRALVRRPCGSRPPLALSLVGSGSNGAVVGAPGLQSPTPVILEDQRRAPLRSINTRQPMPMRRRSDILLKSAHKAAASNGSMGVPVKDNDTVAARATLRTSKMQTSTQPYDENARRRSGKDACGGVPVLAGVGRGQKKGSGSKMPVPLRSILTKLRA